MPNSDVQSRERGTVIADSQANLKAAIKMHNEQGHIRAVFECLDLGWSYEDVEDYLLGSPTYQRHLALLGGDQHGLLQGTVMGFAVVVAERVREIERRIQEQGLESWASDE